MRFTWLRATFVEEEADYEAVEVHDSLAIQDDIFRCTGM